MLLKLIRNQVYLPIGFISLFVLPILLFFRIESEKVSNIELNILSNEHLIDSLTLTRNISYQDNVLSVEDFVNAASVIKRINSNSTIYQIPIPRLSKYNDLINILDALQQNGISFFVRDNTINAWLRGRSNEFYPLSHYLDKSFIFNGLQNDVYMKHYTLWEELFMKSVSEIVQDKLFWVTVVIVVSWLILLGFSLNNAIQVVFNRRLTSHSPKGPIRGKLSPAIRMPGQDVATAASKMS